MSLCFRRRRIPMASSVWSKRGWDEMAKEKKSYDMHVALPDGVSIYGGYSDGWRRSDSARSTLTLRGGVRVIVGDRETLATSAHNPEITPVL